MYSFKLPGVLCRNWLQMCRLRRNHPDRKRRVISEARADKPLRGVSLRRSEQEVALWTLTWGRLSCFPQSERLHSNPTDLQRHHVNRRKHRHGNSWPSNLEELIQFFCFGPIFQKVSGFYVFMINSIFCRNQIYFAVLIKCNPIRRQCEQFTTPNRKRNVYRNNNGRRCLFMDF